MTHTQTPSLAFGRSYPSLARHRRVRMRGAMRLKSEKMYALQDEVVHDDNGWLAQFSRRVANMYQLNSLVST
eukprot:3083558-Amphidinium_carterae.2